jgi:hypothetical protein
MLHGDYPEIGGAWVSSHRRREGLAPRVAPLPASPRFSGGGVGESFAESEDSIGNAFDVREYVVVADSENLATAALEHAIPQGILVSRGFVDRAVDLEDEVQRGAVEVGDVAAHEVLPTPAPPAELPLPKRAPEYRFRFGRFGSHLASPSRLVTRRAALSGAALAFVPSSPHSPHRSHGVTRCEKSTTFRPKPRRTTAERACPP